MSTVTETFFTQYLKGNTVLRNNQYLELRAANGLTIPYIGYIELDITCKNNVIKNRGFLVVRDNANHTQKGSVPVLIGMNVINSNKKVLNDVIGDMFSRCIAVEWERQIPPPPTPAPLNYGFARVAGQSRVCVPAGSVMAIRASCSDLCAKYGKPVLIEPLQVNSFPSDLVILNTVSNVRGHCVYVHVANVSNQDIHLSSRARIGSLCGIGNIVLSDNDVTFEPVSNICTTDKGVCNVNSISNDKKLFHIDNNCSDEEYEKLNNLLTNYNDLFVTDETELGYTDKVTHEIKLTDDKPIKQAYRRIPPSQYEEVRQHITELLDKNIIRESTSPYSSPIVIVRKKIGGD